ncbi:MAG: hypothetical protein IIZ33_09505 [Erysipelotrichaceae bacterium]|nr:hypothetical protein [Erysipelotrichaceae bacterium]
MKKLLVILFCLLLLVGCGAKQEEKKEETPEEKTEEKVYSIAVPAGAPALAFYDEIENPTFATGDAKSILPELKGENGSEVIVIDTVNGIKALNGGADYQLAATITFGNFYIAATGHDEDGSMDPGDYVVVFSQGATPDLVFHYLYGDVYDENLHYVTAVSDATPCLVKGVNIFDEEKAGVEDPYVDYVFIAEPALTAASKQNENISVYADVQKLYAEKSGQSMIQASVFLSNKLTDEEKEAFLVKLEGSVNALLENPDLFAEKTAGLSDEEVKEIFGVPNSTLAGAVIKKNNAIGLGFKRAYENKDAIDAFVSIFGVEKTGEEIYFH